MRFWASNGNLLSSIVMFFSSKWVYLDALSFSSLFKIFAFFSYCVKAVNFPGTTRPTFPLTVGVRILNKRRRKFPFRIRSLPFEMVDAISQNGRCHLKRSMPFWQNGRCHLKRSMPFLMTVSWEMASTVSNGNDRLRKGNWQRRLRISAALE